MEVWHNIFIDDNGYREGYGGDNLFALSSVPTKGNFGHEWINRRMMNQHKTQQK